MEVEGRQDFLLGTILFSRNYRFTREIFMISVTWKSETSYRIIKDFEYPFEKKISNNFIRVQTNSNNIYNIDKLILI